MNIYNFSRYCAIIFASFVLLSTGLFAFETVITSVKGGVQILDNTSKKWTDAKVNMRVQSGERIRTSAASEVEVRFWQSNSLKLMEYSSLSFNSDSDIEKDLIFVKISSGKIVLIINRLPENISVFKVSTSEAIVGCLLAHVGVATSYGEHKTRIDVLDGRAMVMNRKGEGKFLALNAGETVNVEKDYIPDIAQSFDEIDASRFWGIIKKIKRKYKAVYLEEEKKW